MLGEFPSAQGSFNVFAMLAPSSLTDSDDKFCIENTSWLLYSACVSAEEHDKKIREPSIGGSCLWVTAHFQLV